MRQRKAQCCGATLLVWLGGAAIALSVLLVTLSACLIGYVEIHPLGGRSSSSWLPSASSAAAPEVHSEQYQQHQQQQQQQLDHEPAGAAKSATSVVRLREELPQSPRAEEEASRSPRSRAGKSPKAQEEVHDDASNSKLRGNHDSSEVETKHSRPDNSVDSVAGKDIGVGLLRISDVWEKFLGSKIQVEFMRERILDRRKAWEDAASRNLSLTRLGMTAVVWPYAAYLHFGVKRVWSLGEYSQWADLCAALLSCGVAVNLLPYQAKRLPATSAFDEADVIFTDYDGIQLASSKHVLVPPAKVWLLDTFGTDGTVTNNTFFGRQLPMTNYPLRRFLSFVPGYAERNTYLGVATLQAVDIGRPSRKKWQCLLWSKVQPWLDERKGFPAWHHELLLEYTKHCHVIATIDAKDTAKSKDAIERCCPDVEIQGVAKPAEFLELMRSSAVYLGVGEPLIAPSAFEALNLGTHVIQPRFPEPKILQNKPITQEWTSQHPFLEKIPEPYVFTVDPRDMSTVAEAFERIRNEFEAYYDDEPGGAALRGRANHKLYRFYEFGEYPNNEKYSIPGFVGRVRGILDQTGPLQAEDFAWERSRHPANLPEEWQ
mmetsp:Transcript_28396/g.60557  ORF Transcript_28396/g.60557 Transcript_28396/m.60557 type:complete len:600 (-) Transcript_28396:90-1889(-)